MDKVRGLVGVPFVSGGRDVVIGMDCWGLVMEIYMRYGVKLPDFTVDAFAFNAIDMLAGEEVTSRRWEEVYPPITEDQAPLVVLMRMHPTLVTHAGVYVGGNRIVHTTKATGVILSRVDALESRIVGWYRPC